ncbi:hypothetical protein [Alkalicoccobacillus gibsonii]|uniref:hypothetical protein n=1 Tax=Alkalicoccobacillus gibsonii TaxID=79881 RepID=UPI0019335A2E|nr:hypothetical protein [Alkalicoccobacillus gibsonii]MBM0064964.1 hypothetical protein [Alkalicoccobacillus gibsonii]
MTNQRVAVPSCYYSFCKDAENRAELYRSYVVSFLKKYHPDLQLVGLEPVKAGSQPYVVCTKMDKEK